MNRNKIIIISGVTASGKSALAYEIAKKLGGVVINADSMQIYRGLPILTAQPTEMDRSEIPHRLYGLLSPREKNDVYDWLLLVREEVNKCRLEGAIPLIVGGTGMYLSRFIGGIRNLPESDKNIREEAEKLYKKYGYDKFRNEVASLAPEAVAKLNQNDWQRLLRIYEICQLTGKSPENMAKNNELFFRREDMFHIDIRPDRKLLYERCENRFRNIFDDALEEVKKFREDYADLENKNYPLKKAIGLEEIKSHIDGKMEREEAIAMAVKKTRNYAKRQYTWFKNQFKSVDFLVENVPNRETVELLLDKIFRE